jgi:hypothetical protein
MLAPLSDGGPESAFHLPGEWFKEPATLASVEVGLVGVVPQTP